MNLEKEKRYTGRYTGGNIYNTVYDEPLTTGNKLTKKEKKKLGLNLDIDIFWVYDPYSKQKHWVPDYMINSPSVCHGLKI
jgi:hypothetical protein